MPPISLTGLLFVFAFVCVLLVPDSGALGDDWYDCEGDAPDLALQGCTRIILQNSSQDTPKGIGRAYLKRGNAYLDKKLYDLAIASYDQAIRLNPADTQAIKARADALRTRDASTALAPAQPTAVAPSCPADHDFYGGECVAITPPWPIRTAPKRKTPIPSSNGFAKLDCKDLWYARNALYADQGYCFKTARGKAAFHNAAYPNVCKPPHGKLPADWEATVAEIKQVERRKGCASSAAPKRKKPVAATNEFAHLNCKKLWHARNKIFADHGYCFKTARAKKAFPNNCFPPYGKNLPAWARNDVRWIKEVEKSKRC